MNYVPDFLAENKVLWDWWKEIQMRGGGEHSEWIEHGWKMTSKHLPNGGSIMTLDIRFDPVK